MTEREKILEGTIRVFRDRGLKFTMDQLSARLGMSKKTIYQIFSSKQEVLLAMVDYLFDRIKDSEREIAQDSQRTTLEKIRAVLSVLPDSYREIDFQQLYLLRDKYPEIYQRVEERLESGWETTLALMKQGMEEQVIRPVPLPIFKMMMEASLEQFFRRDILMRNGMTYVEGLEAVVDLLLQGAETREP